MKAVLLDTSYLVAQFNPDDVHHPAAGEIEDLFVGGEWDDLVLLDAVFAESMTILMRRGSYALAKAVGETLRNSAEVRWIHMQEQMEETWHLFLAQPHGVLSLVDCAIVAAAERLRIQDVASFDQGFDAIPGIRRVPAGLAKAGTPKPAKKTRKRPGNRRRSA